MRCTVILRLVAYVLALTACQFEPTFEENAPDLQPRPLGRIGGGDGGAPSGNYASRRGPRSGPWADVWAGETPAPVDLGNLAGTLPSFAGVEGDGPSVLLDGIAIYSDGAATIAYDLATSRERWRVTGDDALDPGGMFTDGRLVCGTSGAGVDSTVACVDFVTGAPRLRTTLAGVSLGVLVGGEVHDGILTLAGGGYIVALDVASGAELWREFTYVSWRQFVRLGDDLVFAAAMGCGAPGSCLRAVDPRTGMARTAYDARGLAYLFEIDGEGIFTVGYGEGSPSAVAYSAATDTFRTAPEWDGLFAMAPYGLGGLTAVMDDGSAYAWTPSANVCRVDTLTHTTTWCAPFTSPRVREIRVHPNGIFGGGFGGDRDAIVGVPGVALVPTGYALWFEHWGFVGGDYYAIP